uniref:Reverse transcriptase domain-containing protein n=1 Tax=Amphimedon queenslandica TaxID=400682 RepID=A0A1X7TYC4_AMPQE
MPKLFSVIADMIQFIAKSQGVNHITHYLDDFIILGSPNSPQCGRDLNTMVELCQCLGVPLAEDKIEGPSTKLEILGIIFDSVLGQLSLPSRKIDELQLLLHDLRDRKTATKQQIESLAGKL